MDLPKIVRLKCQKGTSDKVYIIRLDESPTGDAFTRYKVTGFGARRGEALKEYPKYEGDDLDAALKAFAKLEKEKRKEYVDDFAPEQSGAGITVSAPTNAQGDGPQVQLANPVDEEQAKDLLADRAWGMQEKFNGRRMTVVVQAGRAQSYNRNGQPTDCRAVEQQAAVLPDCILDGELLGREFRVFDMANEPERPFKARWKEVLARTQELALMFPGGERLVFAARLWVDPALKRDALETLRAANAEGVVFRKLDAPYTAGRPNSGGDLLKHKFWASATVEVLKVNTQRSVQVGLYIDHALRKMCGNVTIPVGTDLPKPGQLIEVRYLYATAGGQLYQPTYLGVRTDKPRPDAESQLKYQPKAEEEA